ncbi:hypothetical protein EFM98_06910 [Propionibacterium freudenreichii]|nr:hypothetical protein [Propionibacterium freudenreichii]
MGGGPSQATGPIYDSFVEQARGRGPRIALAILGAPEQAGASVGMYADPIRQRWPEAQIEPIWLIDEDEGTVEWPTDPEQLGGLVVAGGWAPGYLDALTPLRDEIVRIVRGGVPYMGFSAGAQIVAKHAIVGGWQSHGRAVGPEIAGDGSTEIVVRDGLGLIGSAVDVHIDSQHLLERAISALLDHDISSAIAIDEDTALVVDVASGRSDVVGSGAVHWLNNEGHEVRVRRTQGPQAQPVVEDDTESTSDAGSTGDNASPEDTGSTKDTASSDSTASTGTDASADTASPGTESEPPTNEK